MGYAWVPLQYYLPNPNAGALTAVGIAVGRGAVICDRVASPTLVMYWLAFLLRQVTYASGSRTRYRGIVRLRGLRDDIDEGNTEMGGAIAACVKEFELKKKNPQKTPTGVTENNSHGETSVQTFFRHKLGLESVVGDLSIYAAAEIGVGSATHSARGTPNATNEVGLVTRDATGHVSRSQPNVLDFDKLVFALPNPPRWPHFFEGALHLTLQYATLVCLLTLFPSWKVAGSSSIATICCNIRVYRMILGGGGAQLRPSEAS